MSKRLLLVVLALVVLLAGCKVDTTVSIQVRRDGSGTVTVTAVLDPDAVKAAETGGGKLEDRVRLSDLGQAGWTVEPWARAADGSAQLVLRKPFDTPEEVAGIMRDISGTTGPLRDVSVTRDRGLVSTHYEVKGSLDLAKLQTGVTTDPDLAAALTNQQVDLHAIDESLLAQIRESLGVKVEVHLPGRSRAVVGRAGKATSIDTSSSVLDTKRIALVLVALVLMGLAVFLVVRPGRRARGRPRSSPDVRSLGSIPNPPARPGTR